MRRQSDNGVSLLNVLVVVAAAAGLVQVMLSGQQRAVTNVADARDGAQAGALARSGVTSVAVALRRDMVEAPMADHLQEEWAGSAQQTMRFDAGRFALEVQDIRGRFNLNSLSGGGFLEQRVFKGLVRALDLPEALATAITAEIAAAGPLQDVAALVDLGFAPDDVARLRPHVAAVQSPGPINLNTATEPVLAALLANPAAAQALVARREIKGYLVQDDFRALGLLVPPASGFVSDVFEVSAQAEVGAAKRAITRRIHRDAERGTLVILTGE